MDSIELGISKAAIMGIKYECKKAIGLINKLIKAYKPIDGSSLLFTQYREMLQNKVDEIENSLNRIRSLNKNAICADDYTACYCVDFENFNHIDEMAYNRVFLKLFGDLKNKLKQYA